MLKNKITASFILFCLISVPALAEVKLDDISSPKIKLT